MNIITLAVALAIGQFIQPPVNPAPPAYTWQLTRFTDGHIAWAWGWMDAQGFMHVEKTPENTPGQVEMGAVDATGAANYGVMSESIKGDGSGATVRASSAEAEATAFDVAKRPCPDDSCKIPHPIEDAENEVRRMIVLSVCACAVIVAVAVVLLSRSKR